MGIKKIFHGLVLAVLSYLVIVCLLITANGAVFTTVTSNPSEVKGILADSGAYQNITPVILDMAEGQTGSQDLPIGNPQVRKIAAETFDGQFAQQSVEDILDGTYSWLEGRTSEPEFKVNIDPARQKFTDRLTDYAVKRLSRLPVCSYAETQKGLDVFTSKCAPAGLNRATIKSAIEKNLAQQPGLLAERTINPSDIKNEQGTSVFKQLEGAPKVFQTAKFLPLLTALIGLAATLWLVLLSETRRKALRHLGISLLIGGLLLLMVPSIFAGTFEHTLASSQDALTRKVLSPILVAFNGRVALVYQLFGLGSLVAGAASLFGGWRLGKVGNPAEPSKR